MKNDVQTKYFKIEVSLNYIIFLFYLFFDKSNSVLVKNHHDAIKLEQKINEQKEEINNKIIFNSPFYKKRNKITSTFRNFSNIISSEEIDKFSSEIWRKFHWRE